MNHHNGNISGERDPVSHRRQSRRSLPRSTLRNDRVGEENQSLTNSNSRNVRGTSLPLTLLGRRLSSDGTYRRSNEIDRNSHLQTESSLRVITPNERILHPHLCWEADVVNSNNKDMPLHFETAAKANNLIEQIRDIKRRLSEVTIGLSPTLYPVATRDVLTAVALGQYEATHYPKSSSEPVSDKGDISTHDRCSHCDEVLGFLAYLISANPSFEQPRWVELKSLLRGQRLIKALSGCPNLEKALHDLVAGSSDLTISMVPLAEMQEMEKRLQTVDAEVLHLQNQVQILQKLLDDIHTGSSWHHRAGSVGTGTSSMQTSSIVAWLDLATSNSISDTESEPRRQTNNSSRQACEQEVDIRAKITALIADKEAELAELRRGAVKWTSKHTLIRNKQAEIEELNCILSNEYAQAPDVSEAETLTGSPNLQLSNVEELIGHIQTLRQDLTGFVQSFGESEAQQVVPHLEALSDTLTKSYVRLRPTAQPEVIATDESFLKTAAHLDYLRYQQLEVGRANCSLSNVPTRTLEQPIKTVESADVQFPEIEDVSREIDEILLSIPDASRRNSPINQAFHKLNQKIIHLNKELMDKNEEVEELRKSLNLLEREVDGNKEALQLLCESRFTLLERVSALTGGDGHGDSFALFMSDLRENNTLDGHLKSLDAYEDVLVQRLMDWWRKCQADSEVALKNKEVEMRHLLSRLEEEEALLKSYSDETEELRGQIERLQQSLPPGSRKLRGPSKKLLDESVESSPLLEGYQDPILFASTAPLKRTPSTDSEEFQPYSRAIGKMNESGPENYLQSKVDEQTVVISQLEARLCMQNEEYRSKLAEADEKTSQFYAIRDSYETDIQRLKAVLRQKTSDFSELQQVLSSSRQEILGLADQVKEIQCEKEAFKKQCEAVQEELLCRNLEFEKSQGSLNGKTQELIDLREILVEHESQMRNLRFVLNNKDYDIGIKDREISMLSSKLSALEAESEAIRNDFKQLNAVFEILWKSTLLVDDSEKALTTLEEVRTEPMCVLKSSSAVDQFLGLLFCKEPGAEIRDLQACIKAYKSFRDAARAQNFDTDESTTIVVDDPCLPWNPCCVTAVSAISTITGDAKFFNLLRDLAYSESCRVRLANLLSNAESQIDQLKGMLSALQAEVENNHIQLAERNRQLILLSKDSDDTLDLTLSKPTEAICPDATNQDTSKNPDNRAHFKNRIVSNDENLRIVESATKSQANLTTAIPRDSAKYYDLGESKAIGSKIDWNESEYDIKDLQILAQKLKTEANCKSVMDKFEAMEAEIYEQAAEKMRLQQQLHKVREKLEKIEMRMTNDGKGLTYEEYKKEKPTLINDMMPAIMTKTSEATLVPVEVGEQQREVEEVMPVAVESELFAVKREDAANAARMAEIEATNRELEEALRLREAEKKTLEERLEEAVAAAARDAEVASSEMEALRDRLKGVEEESVRKSVKCEALSAEVEELTHQLVEARSQLPVSPLEVVEPSVVKSVMETPLLSAMPPTMTKTSEATLVPVEVGEQQREVEEVMPVAVESELFAVKREDAANAARMAEIEATNRELEEALRLREAEKKTLEERLEEAVAAAARDAEVASSEMEALRDRLKGVEEESVRKSVKCEALSAEVEELTHQLVEARSQLPVSAWDAVEAMKTEPLWSSVGTGSSRTPGEIVDICHAYGEESGTPRVDEGLLMARLTTLAEQVSAASSLQGEVRNSWLEVMEQAELGVDRLLQDQVDLKLRLGELEADVRTRSEAVVEREARVEQLRGEVARQEEELRQRDCRLCELEAGMTEVSSRLLSQLGGLMKTVTCGEGRMAELMSMVEEVSGRESELRAQVAEKTASEREMQSELEEERVKVRKMAEEMVEKETEKDELLKRCDHVAEEVKAREEELCRVEEALRLREAEKKTLEERLEEAVAAAARDAEVASSEMEALRDRLKGVEEESVRKSVKCEALSAEVEELTHQLVEARSQLPVSPLEVVEPSVVKSVMETPLLSAMPPTMTKTSEATLVPVEVGEQQREVEEVMPVAVESELFAVKREDAANAARMAEIEATNRELEEALRLREAEKKTLEERLEEAVAAAARDAEVASSEMEALRDRLKGVEEESVRKSVKCEALSAEVEELTHQLVEARSQLPVSAWDAVEAMKTEPLWSSVGTGSSRTPGEIVDICHAYGEESGTPRVDEGLLMARLTTLAEQVSAASSLQGEVRNSWLEVMEQAELGVDRLLQDQVDLKLRLGELEADVRTRSEAVVEREARVEQLRGEVARQEEELRQRDCRLCELEAGMTEVSSRLLSQLGGLMKTVTCGEGRMAELMSMVEEVSGRESELRAQVAEKTASEREMQSELEEERVKVRKMAEEMVEKETEKDELLKRCDHVAEEVKAREEELCRVEEALRLREAEKKTLEERLEEAVAAAARDAEVASSEMEALRDRLKGVEEESVRKSVKCEALSAEVEELTHQLVEARSQLPVSPLEVVEPSVVKSVMETPLLSAMPPTMTKTSEATLVPVEVGEQQREVEEVMPVAVESELFAVKREDAANAARMAEIEATNRELEEALRLREAEKKTLEERLEEAVAAAARDAEVASSEMEALRDRLKGVEEESVRKSVKCEALSAEVEELTHQLVEARSQLPVSAWDAVEAMKTEPLWSSVGTGSSRTPGEIVDICHAYGEESGTPRVDEGLLMARLTTLAEQVSAASSLQGEVRNSWLEVMEQAELGVDRLLQDQVDLKLRLGELEADVRTRSEAVVEREARVEQLRGEVARQEEELRQRDCRLCELEAGMTEVSSRLLSQLGGLMKTVTCGEGRMAELMSMVEEVSGRESELRAQVAEKTASEREMQSELEEERVKVRKMAEEMVEKETEKDELLKRCDHVAEEVKAREEELCRVEEALRLREAEKKTLEERLEEAVAAAARDAKVASSEMEALRDRLKGVEEESVRKSVKCEALSAVEELTHQLVETRSPLPVSPLEVVEPSVVKSVMETPLLSAMPPTMTKTSEATLVPVEVGEQQREVEEVMPVAVESELFAVKREDAANAARMAEIEATNRELEEALRLREAEKKTLEERLEEAVAAAARDAEVASSEMEALRDRLKGVEEESVRKSVKCEALSAEVEELTHQLVEARSQLPVSPLEVVEPSVVKSVMETPLLSAMPPTMTKTSEATLVPVEVGEQQREVEEVMPVAVESELFAVKREDAANAARMAEIEATNRELEEALRLREAEKKTLEERLEEAVAAAARDAEVASSEMEALRDRLKGVEEESVRKSVKCEALSAEVEELTHQLVEARSQLPVSAWDAVEAMKTEPLWSSVGTGSSRTPGEIVDICHAYGEESGTPRVDEGLLMARLTTLAEQVSAASSLQGEVRNSWLEVMEQAELGVDRLLQDQVDLKLRLGELEADVRTRSEAVVEREARVEQLRGEVARQEEELRQRDCRLCELEAGMTEVSSRLLSQLGGLMKTVTCGEGRMAELMSMVEEVSGRESELRAQVAEKTASEREMQSELEEERVKVRKMAEEMVEKETEKDELLKRCDHVAEEVKAREEELCRVEEALRLREAEKKTLEERLEEAVAAAARDAEVASSEMEALRDRLKGVEEESVRKSVKCEALSAEVEELTHQLVETRSPLPVSPLEVVEPSVVKSVMETPLLSAMPPTMTKTSEATLVPVEVGEQQREVEEVMPVAVESELFAVKREDAANAARMAEIEATNRELEEALRLREAEKKTLEERLEEAVAAAARDAEVASSEMEALRDRLKGVEEESVRKSVKCEALSAEVEELTHQLVEARSQLPVSPLEVVEPSVVKSVMETPLLSAMPPTMTKTSEATLVPVEVGEQQREVEEVMPVAVESELFAVKREDAANAARMAEIEATNRELEEALRLREAEKKTLEERLEEAVAAAARDAEVASSEMEALRDRLKGVEEESVRKSVKCEALSAEVEELTHQLVEARSQLPVSAWDAVEAMKTEPLWSSVGTGSSRTPGEIVDICHAYGEESGTPRVDEGLLMARLTTLAEQVSAASSLQGEVRNSWLEVMEQAELGVDRLLQDQVDLKLRLGELEADVRTRSEAVVEREARVEQLRGEVARQEEELRQRDCRLCELEAGMTEVSSRLLSQLGGLMKTVTCGEGRMAELMSMVEEVSGRESELRAQVAEKTASEREMQSELEEERVKVRKMAEEMVEKETEKDELLKRCDHVAEEVKAREEELCRVEEALRLREAEKKTLEERLEEAVAAAARDAEVASSEMEALRDRLKGVEEESVRKSVKCEALSAEVEELTHQLVEARSQLPVSPLEVVEPSVVKSVMETPLLSAMPPTMTKTSEATLVPVEVGEQQREVEEVMPVAVESELFAVKREDAANAARMAEIEATNRELEEALRLREAEKKTLEERLEEAVAAAARDAEVASSEMEALRDRLKGVEEESVRKSVKCEALSAEVEELTHQLVEARSQLPVSPLEVVEPSVVKSVMETPLLSAMPPTMTKTSEATLVPVEVGEQQREVEEVMPVAVESELFAVKREDAANAARMAEIEATNRELEEALRLREAEKKTLEERLEEAVAAAARDAEVASSEMEALRDRLKGVEEESVRKSVKCEALSAEVEELTHQLVEARSQLPVSAWDAVEAMKTEPLWSSVGTGSSRTPGEIVDICHAYGEESGTPRVDEGLLMARLTTLAEQVSAASSLQGEVRNSWLEVMEQAELGVDRLLQDQVDLKLRLGELEADVRTRSEAVVEREARVEQLRGEVARQEEELRQRDCRLCELEAGMTEVSSRLLSQLGGLMKTVTCGEGRMAELMSMVEEVSGRESELRAQVAEKTASEREMQSELEEERVKVRKMAEEMVEKETEKDELLKRCDHVAEEVKAREEELCRVEEALRLREAEKKTLEERLEEAVAAAARDAKVASSEMEALRDRLKGVEEESVRKSVKCEALSAEVEELTHQLVETRSPLPVSPLEVVEPSVVKSVMETPLLSAMPPTMTKTSEATLVPVEVGEQQREVEEVMPVAVESELFAVKREDAANAARMAEIEATNRELEEALRLREAEKKTLEERLEEAVAAAARDAEVASSEMEALRDRLKGVEEESVRKSVKCEALSAEVEELTHQLVEARSQLPVSPLEVVEPSVVKSVMETPLLSAMPPTMTKTSEATLVPVEVGEQQREVEEVMPVAVESELFAVKREDAANAARMAEIEATNRELEEALRLREAEKKTLEERLEEAVAAAARDAEVASSEMEALRDRLKGVEEESVRKSVKCEALSAEVEELTHQLVEARSQLPVSAWDAVEAMKTEPLWSSVGTGSSRTPGEIVDICHAYGEESGTPRVDEGLLMARLTTLAEQVSAASSLQGEVRNSWLEVMEQAELGVDRLLQDQVDLKLRLGELEADVRTRSEAVVEREARVEQLRGEVARQEEELRQRDCRLCELEAGMTEVSSRLLSQLGGLMKTVTCGEGRMAELMSMVEEVSGRESELRAQVAEKTASEREMQSELEEERVKVRKMAEEMVEKETEKDELLKRCDHVAEEVKAREEELCRVEEALRLREAEKKTLEERLEEAVAAAARDAEVASSEMEALRDRLKGVEEESVRKSVKCEALSAEVEELTHQLVEARSQLPVSPLEVVEPSVVKSVMETPLLSAMPPTMTKTSEATLVPVEVGEQQREVEEVMPVAVESELFAVKREDAANAARMAEIEATNRELEEALRLREAEKKTLEERLEEAVAAAARDAKVASSEMEALRDRLKGVEEESVRKSVKCEALSAEVEELTHKLVVVNSHFSQSYSAFGTPTSLPEGHYCVDSSSAISDSFVPLPAISVGHREACPLTLSPFYASLPSKVLILLHFVQESLNVLNIPIAFSEFPIFSASLTSLVLKLSALLSEIRFAFSTALVASGAVDTLVHSDTECISPFSFPQINLESLSDFSHSSLSPPGIDDPLPVSAASIHSLFCVASCLNTQLERLTYSDVGFADEESAIHLEIPSMLSTWSDFFGKFQHLCYLAPMKLQPNAKSPLNKLTCLCHLSPTDADQQMRDSFAQKPETLVSSSLRQSELSSRLPMRDTSFRYCSQSEPNLRPAEELSSQRLRLTHLLDAFWAGLSVCAGQLEESPSFSLATLLNQLSGLRLCLVNEASRPHKPPFMAKFSRPFVSLELPSTELYLRRLLNIRDTEVLYLLSNLPGGENLIDRSFAPNVLPSRDCTEAQLRLMSNWDLVQPLDPSCIPVYRVKLPESDEAPVLPSCRRSEPPAFQSPSPSPGHTSPRQSASHSETSQNSLELESTNEVKALLRRCWNLLKEMVSTLKRSSLPQLLQTQADEMLATSLRLTHLLNGESGISTKYEVTEDSALYGDFQRIPESPGLPQSWSRAPIQELIWAIDTLEDIEELRSLANLLTQQYNAIGTTLEQQLNVNRDLRDRLRAANNHLARIYLGVSQGSQRLAVMTERLLVEAQRQDGTNPPCGDIPPTSGSPDGAEGFVHGELSGPSASTDPQPYTSRKTERHKASALLRHLRYSLKPKTKK